MILQNQYSFIMSKLGKEESFLNLLKNIYRKSTANIMCNDKKLENFPLRSEASQGYFILLLLVNIVLVVLANATRQEKKMNSRNTGKRLKTLSRCYAGPPVKSRKTAPQFMEWANY